MNGVSGLKLLISVYPDRTWGPLSPLCSLVIPKENTWTDNIKKQIHLLHKNYPDKGKIIKELFKTYKNPVSNRKLLIYVIEEAGKWFDSEFSLVTLKQDDNYPHSHLSTRI